MATRGWRLMLKLARLIAPPIARLWERGDALMERMQEAAEEARREREEQYVAMMSRTSQRERE